MNVQLKPCRLCREVPDIDNSTNCEGKQYSTIACGCGVEVSIRVKQTRSGIGMSTYEIERIMIENAMKISIDKWNKLHE